MRGDHGLVICGLLKERGREREREIEREREMDGQREKGREHIYCSTRSDEDELTIIKAATEIY